MPRGVVGDLRLGPSPSAFSAAKRWAPLNRESTFHICQRLSKPTHRADRLAKSSRLLFTSRHPRSGEGPEHSSDEGHLRRSTLHLTTTSLPSLPSPPPSTITSLVFSLDFRCRNHGPLVHPTVRPGRQTTPHHTACSCPIDSLCGSRARHAPCTWGGVPAG